MADTPAITDRQRAAYDLHAANTDKTYTELGAMMTPPIKGGTFSNLINNAREALGESRGGNGGGGGRTAKPPTAVMALDEAIARVESSVERASNRVESARESVTETESDDWADTFVAAEIDRRNKSVTDAVAALDAARESVAGEVEKLRAVRATLVPDDDDESDNG